MSPPLFPLEARTLVLYGRSGLLGSSIEAEARKRYARVLLRSWQEPLQGLTEELRGSPADIVFAGGLTDPTSDPQNLREANVDLPQQVIHASDQATLKSTPAHAPAHRYLTFGTIMERFPTTPNAYIQSKIELSRWIENQSPGRLLHLRLHTLYGGRPKPHMFLAQMLDAIAKQKPFRMSAGQQLREYHAAADVGASVLALLERNWEGLDPILELSSGAPVRLAELAREIFLAFDQEKHLEIGALATPPVENHDNAFTRSPDWLLPEAGIRSPESWLGLTIAFARIRHDD